MSERNMPKDHISKEKIPAKKPAGKVTKATENGKNRQAVSTGDRRRHSPGSNVTTQKGHPGHRIWIALWMLLCVILLLRIWDLNHTIDTLKLKNDKLTRIVLEQREKLELFAEALETGQKADSQGGEQGNGQSSGAQNESSTQNKGAEGAQGEAAAVNGQGIAHKVYLTFDDGPSAYTQDILDILEEYGVKATFFVVGREGAQAEETLEKIVEAGHTLGMHSYTHDYDEIYASVDNFAADLEQVQDLFYDVTGVKSTVYRFPGGSSNTVSDIDMREFAVYLDSQGVRFFDWNISSGDGGSFLVPVETLIENCTSTIKSHETSVVLMHDVAGKTTTREALPKIIETIQAMDDTAILPITDDTPVIQHIQWQDKEKKESDSVQKQNGNRIRK